MFFPQISEKARLYGGKMVINDIEKQILDEIREEIRE